MDVIAQILELERQVKATEYATKKHEDELKRLHGEVAKAAEKARHDARDVEPKEREHRELLMRLTNVEREMASKKALVELDQKALSALQAREKKEEVEVSAAHKNITSLKQKLETQRRTAQHLNDLKKKQGF